MSSPNQPGAPDPRGRGPLAVAEIRRRAVGGAGLLAARGALILGLGVVANIILARLLDPRDFGLVALGTVMITFAHHLADGGLAASLLRRNEHPTRRELAAVNGLQLGVAVPLTVVVAVVAATLFGRDGLVVATMVASMPIVAMRAPSNILLERKLRYREIATVDVVDALVFYAWSLTAVGLGMGVWGMATGVVARALAGTTTMLAIGPVGLMRPRWSWAVVRPLLPFGTRFQAAGLVSVARDQGMNAMVAAVAGIATLGVWNLAWRVLQVPYMMFGATGRVWYPTMSRLLEAGQNPLPAITRAASTLAVATGLVLAALAGFAPALPELVGPEWGDVSPTLLWAALALVLAAPVPVAATGYLYAVGAAGAVVRTLVAGAVVWLAVSIPLVATIGAPGIGLGWIASAVATLTLFARELRVRAGSSPMAGAGVPTVIALLAVGSGWAVAQAAGESVLAGLAGAAGGEIVLLTGLVLFRRTLLRGTWRLLADAAGGLLGREAEPRPAPTAL